MKRRELIKKAGIISVAGLGIGSLLSSCKEGDPNVLGAKPEKSKREKLIINRQKIIIHDAENPTDFELKHSPDIKLGETDEKGFTIIDIIVGQKNIIHPTEANHWIDYVMLYADEELLGEILFELGRTSGYTSMKAKLDGVKVLRAEIGCNLHGIWESSLKLT